MMTDLRPAGQALKTRKDDEAQDDSIELQDEDMQRAFKEALELVSRDARRSQAEKQAARRNLLRWLSIQGAHS